MDNNINKIADEIAGELQTALPPMRLERTLEEEQRIKAVGLAICQTYISTALIASMASRSPATAERWQRELARGQAIQSLFTDPEKWSLVATLIWPNQ